MQLFRVLQHVQWERRKCISAKEIVSFACENEAFRRLAAAMILTALTDAREGKQPQAGEARAWLESEYALQLAQIFGIDNWPPNEAHIQLANKRDLYKRLGWYPTQKRDDDDLLGLSVANARDHRRHETGRYTPSLRLPGVNMFNAFMRRREKVISSEAPELIDTIILKGPPTP